MKKIYNFFGPVLSIILLFVFLVDSLITAIFVVPIRSAVSFQGAGIFISYLASVSFICAFAASAFYVIIGIYLIFTAKNAAIWYKGRQIIFRGIAGMIAAFLLYFLLSYIAGFYAININSLGQAPRALNKINIFKIL